MRLEQQVILTIVYIILCSVFDGTRAANEGWFKSLRNFGKLFQVKDVSQMIQSTGFGVQDHWVVTEDGYILQLQRVINPLVTAENRSQLRPVILQHGLLSNCVDFVVGSPCVKPTDPFEQKNKFKDDFIEDLNRTNLLTLPEDTQEHPNALAFYLANRGYDVFLSNTRGSTYGQRHVKLSSWNPKFWDFSQDEMIKYDLPAVIRYIQIETGYDKVAYVGHSQGTLIMFGLLADQPNFADIVEPFIALAPVAYISNMRGPGLFLAKNTPNINSSFLTGNKLLGRLLKLSAQSMTVRKKFFASIMFFIAGKDKIELDLDTLPERLSVMPGGTSFKNIAHYGQQVKSNRIAKFDYGSKENLVRYNQTEPPEYDIRKIRSKSVILFTGDNDPFSTHIDIQRLKSNFTVPLYATYNMSLVIPQFNHLDSVFGKHSGQLINRRIAKILDKFTDSRQPKPQFSLNPPNNVS